MRWLDGITKSMGMSLMMLVRKLAGGKDISDDNLKRGHKQNMLLSLDEWEMSTRKV